jgi:hypothetical protein
VENLSKIVCAIRNKYNEYLDEQKNGLDESALKQMVDRQDHFNEIPNLIDKKGKRTWKSCVDGISVRMTSSFDNGQRVPTLQYLSV